MSYAKHVQAKKTAQRAPIPGREREMEQMASGGYAFSMDPFAQLKRFLILGSEGGSFYVSEQKLTADNAKCVVAAMALDMNRAVDTIIDVSKRGLAPKNKPALFALALAFAHANVDQRPIARRGLYAVARTASDFQFFVNEVNQLRGWGRGLKHAIGDWFQNLTADDLAYQAFKYQAREGWSLADVLRKSHPKFEHEVAAKNAIAHWLLKKELVEGAPARLVAAHECLHAADAAAAVRLIVDHNLPREVVPTALLNDKDVWRALLQRMPLHACIRNLGKMTRVGALENDRTSKDLITSKLTGDNLRKSRMHPLGILAASVVYEAGRGVKGSLTWAPLRWLIEALENAYHDAFDNVEPSGKRILYGIDISGSMAGGRVNGMDFVTAAQVAASLALAGIKREEFYDVVGFATSIHRYSITRNSRLNDVIRSWPGIGEGTDCSVPIRWAQSTRTPFDAIVLVTDGESWAGDRHVSQAIKEYRNSVGIDTKLVIAYTSAQTATLADPSDKSSLDIAGFDASMPALITNFVKGEV